MFRASPPETIPTFATVSSSTGPSVIRSMARAIMLTALLPVSGCAAAAALP